MGSILTAGMMLEHLGMIEAAKRVEDAVIACVNEGEMTKDVGGTLGTREVGDAVVGKL
jgi:isocitrate/isopropylmalate dehydrogenase